ncbi:class II glutamine amidotransferase [Kitasatospora sp. NPDC088346]|uniref:class II glutamine amidotransferase n=1 Tax=Kitasatospora sp. NPDC088346 TaxID=3364073 RepID=UPI0038059FA1
MCRLILAHGSFAAADIAAAAVQMSCGATADHDNATTVHAHGWGAVWRDPVDGGLRVHRDVRPAADSLLASPVAHVRTDFLAIHVRNATLPGNRGLTFTHPLERPEDDWYFMHNGYLPTVYELLGMSESVFDSAEYFDYLIPPRTAGLEQASALARLRAIPPGGMSGNAIAVHPDRAHLVHWSPPGTRTPVFFAMHRHTTADRLVVASEIVADLAPAEHWDPLPADTVLTFPFTREGARPGAREAAREGARERTPSCPLPGSASSTTSTGPQTRRPTAPAS